MSSVPHGGQTPPEVESVAPDQVMDWLRSLLEQVGRIDRLAGGFRACCPAHDDRTPSLSVKPGRVRVMLHCFAGCDEAAVLAALGVTEQDLFYEHYRFPEASSRRSRAVSKPVAARAAVEPQGSRFEGLKSYKSLAFPGLGRPSVVYDYADADGVVRYAVARFQTGDGKSFRQFTPCPDGGWWRKGPEDAAKVLYRLPTVRAGITAGVVVVLVEGEKDADNGAALLEADGGLVFTSAAGGAKAHWLPQYTDELRDARLVRIIADRDDPGREHAWTVAAALDEAGIQYEVVESDRAKDWTDHVTAGGTMSDLVACPPPPPPTAPPPIPDEPDEGSPRRRKRLPKFLIDEGELCKETWEKTSDGRWGRVLTPVLGCAARIISVVRPLSMDEDLDEDQDGRVTHYVVEFTHPDGQRAPLRFTVPVKEWREGGFLESLWPDVYRPTDRSGRNTVLLGIQQVSGDADFQPTFSATGWGVLDGRPAYFHRGGAITADGLVPAKVKLEGSALAGVCIERPSASVAQVRADMMESMGLLHSGWLPRRIWSVLAGAVYRSILPKAKLVTLGVGEPGTLKTALNVLAGQHFVPGMDSLVEKSYLSMGTRGATVTIIQKVQHAAKDMALVIDDAPRKMSGRDLKAEGALADMITSTYDEARRDRADREGNGHIGPKPRGTVLGSAEYAPTMDGARERCLVWTPPWGKNPKKEVAAINVAQQPERAAARSRFLAWVIQQSAKVTAAELKRATVQAQGTYMFALVDMGIDQRAAEHAAKCMTGWWWVVSRLEEAGVLDHEEAQGWLDEAWQGVIEAAKANADPESDSDTVSHLLRLISQALGRGYLADATRQDSPPTSLEPVDCGWQELSSSSQVPIWRSSGPRMGWVRGDRLYLDPAEVFRAVQQIAADEGTLLTVFTVAAASGLLAKAVDGVRTDDGRYSHVVKVGRMNRRVWDVPLSQFWDPDQGPNQWPDPDGEPPQSPSAPPIPSTAPDLTCVVCGERLIPIDGSDRHPGCDDRPSVTHSQVSVKQETSVGVGDRSPSNVASTNREDRWWAAEVMLTSEAAVLPDGTRWPLPDVAHVGDLARWAGEMRIGSGGGKGRPEPGRVWLSREWLESHRLPVRSAKLLAEGRPKEAGERVSKALATTWQSDPFITNALNSGYELGRNSMNGWGRVWKRGTKDSAVITSAEWVSAAALTQGDTTPEHLIRRLGLWTQATGQPLIIQEGVTFKAMCRLNGLDLPDLPWAAMAADFMWQRDPSPADLAMSYVHCYDRRKSYLAACASVEASDTLEHVTDPPIDPKRPGFWHLSACDWADQGFDLPDPRLDYDGNICDWVATPTLALLAEHCHHLEVDEAWLYGGRTSRVCETAYKTTRTALALAESWKPDDDVAALIAALKASYRLGIGQMAQTKDAEAAHEGTRKRGYRPDVRASIIATHRANSIRAMLWAGTVNRWPMVMARADSVLFASDEPDPVKAWPGRADGMSERLGKYKAAGTQTMNEWERLALPQPVSPSRSIWAVTDPAEAEAMLDNSGGGVMYESGGERWVVDDDGRPTRVA